MKNYLQSEGISDVVQKAKGMTTYFHRSSHRLDRLVDLHKMFDMPHRKRRQTGNTVRRYHTHDSMNWFWEQKVVVQNMISTLVLKPAMNMHPMLTATWTTMTGR